MFADDFRDVVPICVSRIRVVGSVWDVTVVFCDSVVDAATQADSRQLVPSVHLGKEISSGIAPALPGIRVGCAGAGKNDMVGGVAEHEFIQQSWRCVGGETRHEGGCRACEISLNGRKGCPVRPQGDGSYCRP